MASCRNNSGGFGFESEFVVRCQFASGVRETRERERETERERERETSRRSRTWSFSVYVLETSRN